MAETYGLMNIKIFKSIRELALGSILPFGRRDEKCMQVYAVRIIY